MKTITDRQLAIGGAVIGVVGLALEWNKIFPAGIAAAIKASPLGTSPLLNRGGTTAATGRPAVSTTASTYGSVTPYGTTSIGGYRAGAPLGGPSSSNVGAGLGSFFANLFGGASRTTAAGGGATASKPVGAGGASGGSGVSFGGTQGSSGSGAGGGAQNKDTNPTAAGADPNLPYVDLAGNIAYPDANSSTGYSDENGNPVYINSQTGQINWIDTTQAPGYDSTKDPSSLDFIPVGPVDPYGDPNQPGYQAQVAAASNPTATTYDPTSPFYQASQDTSSAGFVSPTPSPAYDPNNPIATDLGQMITTDPTQPSALYTDPATLLATPTVDATVVDATPIDQVDWSAVDTSGATVDTSVFG